MINSFQRQERQSMLRRELGAFLVNTSSLEIPLDYATTAFSEHVGPFFLYRLRETGIDPQDFPRLEPLLSEARHYAVQSMLQERAMLEVNTALNVAGIKTVWLKGSVLAYTVYPQSNLRTRADLDVLVPPEDFQKALSILYTLDYYDPDKALETPAKRLSHHAHLRHIQYYSIIVELHHRLLGYSGEDILAPDILAQWVDQAIPFVVNDTNCYTLKPEYHLLYICAHAFLQHGEAKVTLRHLLDMHLLITHYTLDWEIIVAEAVTLKWTFLFETALKRVHEYFQTPIPDDVFEKLKRLRTQAEDISSVILKSSGDIRGESVLQLFNHLTLKERTQTIFQIAIPSRDYMRERYDVLPEHSVLPYYPYRWFDQSRGLIIAFYRRIMNYLGKTLDK